jgi:hypothetical protein
MITLPTARRDFNVRFSEVNLNVGSIPAGDSLCDPTRMRLFGKFRARSLRLIRSLPFAHPDGLRPCRGLPTRFIPAGDKLRDLGRGRLFGRFFRAQLGLIRSP